MQSHTHTHIVTRRDTHSNVKLAWPDPILLNFSSLLLCCFIFLMQPDIPSHHAIFSSHLCSKKEGTKHLTDISGIDQRVIVKPTLVDDYSCSVHILVRAKRRKTLALLSIQLPALQTNPLMSKNTGCSPGCLTRGVSPPHLSCSHSLLRSILAMATTH